MANALPIKSIEEFNSVAQNILNDFMGRLLDDERYTHTGSDLNFDGIALFSNYKTLLALVAGSLFPKEDLKYLNLEATNYLIADTDELTIKCSSHVINIDKNPGDGGFTWVGNHRKQDINNTP